MVATATAMAPQRRKRVIAGGGAGTLLIWAAVEGDANPDFMVLAVGTGAVLASLGVTAGDSVLVTPLP